MGSSAARWRRSIFLVGHVLTPGDGAARVIDLLHGDVGHEAVGCGAVPVVLAGFEVNRVAGPDDLDRATAPLTEAHTLGHVDVLAEGMRVPGGPGSRSEMDTRGLEPGRFRGRG